MPPPKKPRIRLRARRPAKPSRRAFAAKRKPPALTEGMLDRLRSPYAHVRLDAALELAKSKHPGAVPTLFGALRGRDSWARQVAAEALGKIGKAALPRLVAELKSANVNARWSAATALGETKNPAAVPALKDTMLADADGHVRWSAATALGKIKSPASVQALLGALPKENDKWVKARIIEAIGESGAIAAKTKGTVEALRALRNNPSERIRQSANAALRKIIGRK